MARFPGTVIRTIKLHAGSFVHLRSKPRVLKELIIKLPKTVGFRAPNLQRSGDCFSKDLKMKLCQHVKRIVWRMMLLRKAEAESMFSYLTRRRPLCSKNE